MIFLLSSYLLHHGSLPFGISYLIFYPGNKSGLKRNKWTKEKQRHVYDASFRIPHFSTVITAQFVILFVARYSPLVIVVTLATGKPIIDKTRVMIE